LTKAQRVILGHIYRRGRCNEKIRSMAKVCRMHHDYVRLVLRELWHMKMIARDLRAGWHGRNIYTVAPLEGWVVPDADAKAVAAKWSQSEEALILECQSDFLDRFNYRLSRPQAKAFARRLAEDPGKFERVMASVAERIADAAAGRSIRVENVAKYWHTTWHLFQ
jgi:hypothetical protein